MDLVKKPHQRLRMARIAKGYSNAKIFAQKYQLPYTTYISHESGKIILSKKAAKTYAEILQIPTDWLLYGELSSDDKLNKNTLSIHLKRKALEPVVIPMIVTAILKLLDKYDETLDYEKLIKKCYIIASEILSKTDDLEEIESYVSTSVALEKDTLPRTILKKIKE